MQSNRLEIDTLFGTIIAKLADEPDYPGIYLALANTDEGGERRETILALLESAKDTPRYGVTELRLLVYADKENDDYTKSFTFQKEGQSQYDIWIEKQNNGSYTVRVWDQISDTAVSELEVNQLNDLPHAISSMGRVTRNNPDIQWHFRNFNLEVKHG